jgi:predicted subunit of tRNA(5-methylaminomethyl-2-thiouridylate) methyltransferase
VRSIDRSVAHPAFDRDARVTKMAPRFPAVPYHHRQLVTEIVIDAGVHHLISDGPSRDDRRPRRASLCGRRILILVRFAGEFKPKSQNIAA